MSPSVPDSISVASYNEGGECAVSGLARRSEIEIEKQAGQLNYGVRGDDCSTYTKQIKGTGLKVAVHQKQAMHQI